MWRAVPDRTPDSVGRLVGEPSERPAIQPGTLLFSTVLAFRHVVQLSGVGAASLPADSQLTGGHATPSPVHRIVRVCVRSADVHSDTPHVRWHFDISARSAPTHFRYSLISERITLSRLAGTRTLDDVPLTVYTADTW